MKIYKFFILFILFFVLLFTNLGGKKEYPVLEGPYMGQKSPGITPDIFAPGIISSKKYQEFSCSFSPDGKEFYFTREMSPDRWVIMHMKHKKEGWTKPGPAFFSGEYRDLEMSVAPDGQKLFFCSNRPMDKGGELKKDFDIWYLRKLNGGWSHPVHAGSIVNSNANEWYPTASLDGTLYFCGGEKPGLYRSKYSDKGEFSECEMVGNLRSTDIIGGHPYIAPDESYILTSAMNGYDSKGGWDLFISFKKSDGTWTRSKNLGETINTNASEDFPSISPDGKYLFFTRLFKDDNNKNIVNIYWVDAVFIEEFRLKEPK